jgi:3-oxoacyl-[acyl-carrier-protein] synthase II
MRRVVITGMGAVTPCGVDLDTTWAALLRGQSGIGLTTRIDAKDYPSRIAGEVKGLDLERWVPKKRLKESDLFIHFALAAAEMAIQASRFAPNEVEKLRVGTIIGVGLGGMGMIERTLRTLDSKGPNKVSPYFIPAAIGNLAPGQISMRYGFRGASYTTTSACASGAHAIGEAFRAIRLGTLDACISGGAEAAITSLGLAGFSQMRALSTRNDDPMRASRPFDRDRDGFVIAEGAAILVLEEREAAQRRGATIFAEILGYGATADAYQLTQPAEQGEGGRRAMELALAEASVGPSDVSYINAHGTSTGAGDKAELLALRATFGDTLRRIPISSTKSMTGHLLGAAGAAEAAFCALAMRDQIVPPTINLDNPSEEAQGLDLVPFEAKRCPVSIALSNSFGFGGTNVALVLRSP